MADGASGQYRSAAMNTRLAIETFMQAAGALVDVRSPSEFAKAHWPGAVNLPLFDDEGRAEVGTLYKQHCLLYTSPSPRDRTRSRMPSSA